MNLRPENPLKKYSGDNSLIFLLRHGQIRGAEEKRFIGMTDAGLDDVGLSQAGYWQSAFSGLPLDMIYSSRLQRCSRTARCIAGKTPVMNTHALNEINMGEWDNKTFEEIKTRYPEDFIKRGDCIDTFCPPGAESFQDLANRVIPFFNECIDGKKEKHTLIVTHAGVIRVILCHILNRPLKDLFRIKPHYGELFVLG